MNRWPQTVKLISQGLREPGFSRTEPIRRRAEKRKFILREGDRAPLREGIVRPAGARMMPGSCPARFGTRRRNRALCGGLRNRTGRNRRPSRGAGVPEDRAARIRVEGRHPGRM